MPLKYIVPFMFLALVPLGGWLGEGWTFSAAAATPLCLATLDLAGGQPKSVEGGVRDGWPRWLPRFYIVSQLATTAWALARALRPETTLLETAGLVLSTGVTTGVFGFVAAHEMIHSRDRRERALGLALLGSVFYMHFRIAHVYGHHRRAATFEDPATARLGESLYAFLVRSIAGQFREAWIFETKRRGLGVSNRMIHYLVMQSALALAMAVIDWRALAFLVAVAVLAIVLLETFNYVAHYGLKRRPDAVGRLEPLGPRHSWNTGKRMNNAALFNMGRHSDHHRRMGRSYEGLEPVSGEAELPSGYAAALMTAFVPPLWRRVMDRRARAQAG